MSEKSLKLTAYFGERQRALGKPRRFLADEMLDLFGARGVATSVMMRGVASFGPPVVCTATFRSACPRIRR